MNTRFGYLSLIALCWTTIPNLSLADSAETIDELKRCARIAQQDKRIGCYEALGQRGLQEDNPGENANWRGLLSKVGLQGDAHNFFSVDNMDPCTHLRLNIFPDGGVARLRVYGEIRPDRDS